MTKLNFTIILKIIVFGYTVWFLWDYGRAIRDFVPSFWYTHYNACTSLDFFPLAYLFFTLLMFCLIFWLSSLWSKEPWLSRNAFLFSISTFGLLSVHNVLQFALNNQSDILLARPLLLNPSLPLAVLFIIWLLKSEPDGLVDLAVTSSKTFKLFVPIARIAFLFIFSITLLVVLFYHASLIYEVVTQWGIIINEFNCGAYPTPPGTIPPPTPTSL